MSVVLEVALKSLPDQLESLKINELQTFDSANSRTCSLDFGNKFTALRSLRLINSYWRGTSTPFIFVHVLLRMKQPDMSSPFVLCFIAFSSLSPFIGFGLRAVIACMRGEECVLACIKREDLICDYNFFV